MPAVLHSHRMTHELCGDLLRDSFTPTRNPFHVNLECAIDFTEKVIKAKATVSRLRSQITMCQQRDKSAINTQLDFITSTTEVEVLKLISRLPNKTSPLDYVYTSVLKTCSDEFALLIAHLANLSFAEEQFPDQFKLAPVTPLIKKVRWTRRERSC